METTTAGDTIIISYHSILVSMVTKYGEFTYSMCTDLLPWIQLMEVSLVLGGTVGIKMLTSLVMDIKDDVSLSFYGLQ